MSDTVRLLKLVLFLNLYVWFAALWRLLSLGFALVLELLVLLDENALVVLENVLEIHYLALVQLAPVTTDLL